MIRQLTILLFELISHAKLTMTNSPNRLINRSMRRSIRLQRVKRAIARVA